jgi:hypothetical protein
MRALLLHGSAQLELIIALLITGCVLVGIAFIAAYAAAGSGGTRTATGRRTGIQVCFYVSIVFEILVAVAITVALAVKAVVEDSKCGEDPYADPETRDSYRRDFCQSNDGWLTTLVVAILAAVVVWSQIYLYRRKLQENRLEAPVARVAASSSNSTVQLATPAATVVQQRHGDEVQMLRNQVASLQRQVAQQSGVSPSSASV